MKVRFTLNYLLAIAACIFLFSCRVHYNIQDTKTERGVIVIDTNVTEVDSVAWKIIQPYKASMEAEMEEVIAYSDAPLSKALPEGLLNNFVADLVIHMASQYYTDKPIDFCLMNNGGLRASLPKGEIRVRNVYELMPFENKISILVLDGNKAWNLFRYIAAQGGMPMSGIRMGIKDEKPSQVFVQEIPFDSTRNYVVVTIDYLADGGDKMGFFKDPIERIDLPVLIRDAIIAHMRNLTAEGLHINSQLDKRIYYEK